MRNITQAKGSALMIDPDCSAGSPPASSSAAATTPSVTAQKIRCHTGGSSLPPEVIMSITSEPESDEVTKKVIINKVATSDIRVDQGSCSSIINIAVGESANAVFTKLMPLSASSMVSAMLPKKLSHKKVKPAGTKSTPTMNSRIVRPREMRAMNMPTNGDQEIHQAQ